MPRLMSGRTLFAWFGIFLALGLLSACQPGADNQPRPRKDKPEHLVEIFVVERERLRTEIVHPGSLRARRILRLYSQEAGKIIELPFFEGDSVEQGALLARLDERRLQAELEKALAQRQQEEANVRRLSNLAQKKLISEDEIARARTALSISRAEEKLLRVRLQDMRSSAPFSGLISARLVEPGDVIGSQTHLLTLLDPASLVVEAEVSARELASLQIGTAAQVRIDALGERQWAGKILRLHPRIDPANRKGIIEIQLDQLPAGARSGQFCRVTLLSEAREQLTIPATALRRDRQGEYVFTLDADNQAQRLSVRSGLQLADKVEILQGLQEGQRIISKGFLGLKSGTTVTPVN